MIEVALAEISGKSASASARRRELEHRRNGTFYFAG
jgi:hypothetical protein